MIRPSRPSPVAAATGTLTCAGAAETTASGTAGAADAGAATGAGCAGVTLLTTATWRGLPSSSLSFRYSLSSPGPSEIVKLAR